MATITLTGMSGQYTSVVTYFETVRDKRPSAIRRKLIKQKRKLGNIRDASNYRSGHNSVYCEKYAHRIHMSECELPIWTVQ